MSNLIINPEFSSPPIPSNTQSILFQILRNSQNANLFKWTAVKTQYINILSGTSVITYGLPDLSLINQNQCIDMYYDYYIDEDIGIKQSIVLSTIGEYELKVTYANRADFSILPTHIFIDDEIIGVIDVKPEAYIWETFTVNFKVLTPRTIDLYLRGDIRTENYENKDIAIANVSLRLIKEYPREDCGTLYLPP